MYSLCPEDTQALCLCVWPETQTSYMYCVVILLYPKCNAQQSILHNLPISFANLIFEEWHKRKRLQLVCKHCATQGRRAVSLVTAPTVKALNFAWDFFCKITYYANILAVYCNKLRKIKFQRTHVHGENRIILGCYSIH